MAQSNSNSEQSEESTRIISENGYEVWINEKRELHRVNGPAVIHPNGTQMWFAHGRFHRTKGPAVIFQNGTEQWWENGIQISITKIKIKRIEKIRDEDSRSVTELNMFGWLPLEMLNILRNIMIKDDN